MYLVVILINEAYIINECVTVFEFLRSTFLDNSRFRAGQLVRCCAYRKRWCLTDSQDLCSCGRDPDDVSHCRLVLSDKAEWWFVQNLLWR